MERQTRYLAFLDILGFKDLIENNSLDEVVELYESFEPSLLFSMLMSNINYRLKNLNDPPTKFPPDHEVHLNSLFISDSIVLWTDNDEVNSFVELVTTVRQHMNLAIQLGFPLRGAITSGQMEIKAGRHNESSKFNSFNTILGLPLTKAYLLENSAEWSGCIIDDNAIEHYNNKVEETKGKHPNVFTLDGMLRLDFLKVYQVPLKTGKIKNYYTVNWTHFFGDRLSEQSIRDAFNKHNKNTNDWRVETKIRNTINYLKETDEDYKRMVEFLKKRKEDKNDL